jgi:hypothetical protein
MVKRLASRSDQRSAPGARFGRSPADDGTSVPASKAMAARQRAGFVRRSMMVIVRAADQAGEAG